MRREPIGGRGGETTVDGFIPRPPLPPPSLAVLVPASKGNPERAPLREDERKEKLDFVLLSFI
jgi:hypothetical protein